jgi:hypothetical protein
MNKIIKYFFAEFFSSIFNPIVFIFLMPFLIVYRQTASIGYALKWQLFTSVFLTIAVTFLLFGLHKKIFSDIDLTKREERKEFYKMSIILSACYLISSILFKGPVFYISFAAGGIVIGAFILSIINNYTKASVHLAVATAFVATIGVLYGFNVFIFLFWIIPLTLWARHYLGKHTALQMVIGALVGLSVTISTLFIARMFL